MDSDLKQYYRLRAPEYEQIYFREIPERRRELTEEGDRLRELVRGCHVLDLPCGTGYWTEIMAESALSIVAADLSVEMLKEAAAKRYQRPVDFVACDLSSPPFEAGAFDFLAVGFWLSHHPHQDYLPYFKLLRSIVKSDGRIWMIDNNPPAEGTVQQSAGTDSNGNNYKIRRLLDGKEFRILKNYFDKPQLLSLFSEHFEIENFTYNHYYWSAVLCPD